MPASVCGLMIEIGQALPEFTESMASGRELNVVSAFGLWGKVQKQVEQVHLLSHSEKAKHPVIQVVADAMLRLERQMVFALENHLKDMISKNGLAAACDEMSKHFSTQPCPDRIVAMLHSLKACRQVPEQDLSSEGIQAQHDSLHSLLPRYVKLCGLEGKFLGEVAPEKWTAILGFTKTFEQNLHMWLQEQRSNVDKNVAAFKKYRLEQPTW